MQPEKSRWLPIWIAAKFLSVDVQQVLWWLDDGLLVGRVYLGAWEVDEVSVHNLQRELNCEVTIAG